MTITLINGDCLVEMAKLEANSVDSIITDPPYGLEFMGKEWDKGVPGVHFWEQALRVAKPGAIMLAFGGTRTFHRLACAIEDAGWEIRDTIMYCYGSGFPKSHDISKAIDREAGAEREVVGIGRAGNNALGQDSGWNKTYHPGRYEITDNATPNAILWSGWGTALKPAYEPIIVAMKPCDGTFAHNALTWGVAGLNIDGGRIPMNGESPTGSGNGTQASKRTRSGGLMPGNGGNYTPTLGRWPSNFLHDGSDEVLERMPETKSGARTGGDEYHLGRYEGQKGARGLKVGGDCESSSGSAARFFKCCPITEEDLCESASIAELSLRQINQQGDSAPSTALISERQEASATQTGRSQVILDSIGSCSGCSLTPNLAPIVVRQESTDTTPIMPSRSRLSGCAPRAIEGSIRQGDAGARESIFSGASRFKYTAKASKSERDAGCEGMPEVRRGAMEGNIDDGDFLTGSGNLRQGTGRNSHPTIKPLALMRYLCKLTKTPTGGVVLDPFMGSGSTGCAAVLEGRDFIGIELDEQWVEVARRRIEHWQPKQAEMPI